MQYIQSSHADDADNKLVVIGTCILIGMWFLKCSGSRPLKFLPSYFRNAECKWYYCIAHNGIYMNFLLLLFVLQFFCIPLELDRHKAFISACFVYMGFTASYCYVPIKWHIAFATFPLMCFWFGWHWLTGCLNMNALLGGFVLPTIEMRTFFVIEATE